MLLDPCWSPKCPFDLWSPALDSTKAKNVSFSTYAKHEQEKEEVIRMIVETTLRGVTDLSISLDDHFSEADIQYIKEEVCRRLE